MAAHIGIELLDGIDQCGLATSEGTAQKRADRFALRIETCSSLLEIEAFGGVECQLSHQPAGLFEIKKKELITVLPGKWPRRNDLMHGALGPDPDIR